MYQEAISGIMNETQAVMSDLNKLLKDFLALPAPDKQEIIKLENELEIAITSLVTIKLEIDMLAASYVKDIQNIPENSFNQFLKLMSELSAVIEPQILEKTAFQSRVQEFIRFI